MDETGEKVIYTDKHTPMVVNKGETYIVSFPDYHFN